MQNFEKKCLDEDVDLIQCQDLIENIKPWVFCKSTLTNLYEFNRLGKNSLQYIQYIRIRMKGIKEEVARVWFRGSRTAVRVKAYLFPTAVKPDEKLIRWALMDEHWILGMMVCHMLSTCSLSTGHVHVHCFCLVLTSQPAGHHLYRAIASKKIM